MKKLGQKVAEVAGTVAEGMSKAARLAQAKVRWAMGQKIKADRAKRDQWTVNDPATYLDQTVPQRQGRGWLYREPRGGDVAKNPVNQVALDYIAQQKAQRRGGGVWLHGRDRFRQ
jgi:hypothetical protein